jgi:hypothetical protein
VECVDRERETEREREQERESEREGGRERETEGGREGGRDLRSTTGMFLYTMPAGPRSKTREWV